MRRTIKTYYKATRPGATSFYDGKTAWTVGEITELPEPGRGTVLSKAGVLHASTEPGESLVGGSWPCRLFEVEPVGELITEHRHPYKVGAHAWRVVREIEAWRALGPNGEAVVALIERAKNTTYDEVARLGAVRVAVQDTAAWYAARNAAQYAAWYAARLAAQDTAWYAAQVAPQDTAWYAAQDAARIAAWVAAQDAARVAAMALVVRDTITTEQFDQLYGPWKSVMEAGPST